MTRDGETQRRGFFRKNRSLDGIVHSRSKAAGRTLVQVPSKAERSLRVKCYLKERMVIIFDDGGEIGHLLQIKRESIRPE